MECTKHLYIETYGCQMNVADSEVIASVMKMAGYDPCESLDDADAVLLLPDLPESDRYGVMSTSSFAATVAIFDALLLHATNGGM